VPQRRLHDLRSGLLQVSRRTFAGFAVTIVLVACSSSTSSPTSTPDGPCGELVTALCNKLKECFPFAVDVSYKDVDDCIARQNAQCAKSINAPGTGFTPAYASGCASAYRSVSCSDMFKPIDACKTPAGSLADGSACGEDSQCAGRACNRSVASPCGACGKRGAAGSDCTNGAKCEEGLVCAGAGTCVLPAAAGSSCGDGEPCQVPLQCFNGTCIEGGGLGAACSDDRQCDLLKGVHCDVPAGTCAELKIANPGESCDEGISLCGAGSQCKTGARPTGTCESPVADGAPCSADGPSCQEPARCLAGVCTIPDPSECK
jgi:hypothetical protein